MDKRLSPPKVVIGNRMLEQEMRTGWISYYITFQNDVIAISACELITPLVGVVMLIISPHVYFSSLRAIIRM